MILTLTIPGEPHVKERPRCTGRGAVSTPRQRQAEVEIARLLKAKYIVPEPYLGKVYITANFDTGSARKDLDNMVKLVLDALNGVLWGDDSQVVALHVEACRGGQCGPPQTYLEIMLPDEPVHISAREVA